MIDDRPPVHLCIGAPRAGTTWLFKNLRNHPGLDCPPIKEVRWFWGPRSSEEKQRTIRNAKPRDDYDREWLDRWAMLDPTNLADYATLMGSTRPAIDISPMYSIAPPKRVREIERILSAESRVVYLVRDPTERFYSQATLHFHMHGWFRGSLPDREYMALLERPDQLQRSAYGRVVALWRQVFGDRVGVWDHESLQSQPRAVLAEIADFLDLAAADDSWMKDADERVATAAPSRQVSLVVSPPKTLKAALQPRVDEVISDCSTELPSFVQKWERSAKSRPRIDRIERQESVGTDLSDRAIRLLRLTESLGDNCEFGFVQRSVGYEPASLFRWAIVYPEDLVTYLDAAQLGRIYQFENLVPHSPGMVHDLSSGFRFHSKLVSARDESGTLKYVDGEDARKQIHEDELEKVDFFERRFWAFARSKPGIYFIKRNAGVGSQNLDAITESMLNLNAKHQLVHVVVGDRPGAVVRHDASTLVAQVSRFAPYATADDVMYEEWYSIIESLAVDSVLEELSKSAAR